MKNPNQDKNIKNLNLLRHNMASCEPCFMVESYARRKERKRERMSACMGAIGVGSHSRFTIIPKNTVRVELSRV